MRRVLITGASGLLGAHVARAAIGRYDVTALSHTHDVAVSGCSIRRCDLTDRTEAVACLEAARPACIIHCAALTDVEACEHHPQLAQRVNVHATETLVTWAARHQATFVYVSTDAVFDGKEGRYDEAHPPAPLNCYARTKVMAEGIVHAGIPDALIVRTNFYGWHVQEGMASMAEWMLQGLVARERRTLFTDVRFSPLEAHGLARVLLELLSRGASGTYHVAARDHCSKYDFGLMLAEVFGLSPESITPCSVDDHPFLARRPKDMSLRVERVSRFLGRTMPSVKEGLLAFRASAQVVGTA